MVLYVAYLNRAVTCCVTNCLLSYLGKGCQNQVILEICSYLVGFLPPTHCRCTEQPVYLITLNDTHTHTPQTVGLPWTSDQPVAETLPDSTQHSQQTDIHYAPGGIRTHNPRKGAATGTGKTRRLICKLINRLGM